MSSEPSPASAEELASDLSAATLSKKQLKKDARKAEKTEKAAQRQQQPQAHAEDPFVVNDGDVPVEEIQSKTISGRSWTGVGDLDESAEGCYKERFLAALPPSRRASTDFGRPVFTAAAFYLCAKRHKLKVDKLKLIDLCGTSSSEFTTVSTSMGDICFDVFGIAKEKKDPKSVKGNRELLDVLPSKRRHEDDSDLSGESSGDDQDELDLPTYKRHKKMEKQAYDQWKSSVLSSNKQIKPGPTKPRKQGQLNFKKKPSEISLEVSSAAN